MNKVLLYFTFVSVDLSVISNSAFRYIVRTGSDKRDIWNFDFTMKTDKSISFVHIIEFEDFNLTCT